MKKKKTLPIRQQNKHEEWKQRRRQCFIALISHRIIQYLWLWWDLQMWNISLWFSCFLRSTLVQLNHLVENMCMCIRVQIRKQTLAWIHAYIAFAHAVHTVDWLSFSEQASSETRPPTLNRMPHNSMKWNETN